jgi:peroxiredoxin
MTAKPRRPFNPIYFIILGLMLLLFSALMLIYAARKSSDEESTPARKAPDFTLAGLNGDLSLSDFQGQYVLINFWATWCPPCINEMPTLYAYHLAHNTEGFTVLAVNVGEGSATVRNFITSNNFQFPVALDVNSSVFARYGCDSLPTSFLVGPDGKLVKAWEPGALTRSMLDRDVTPLLKG